MAATAVNFLLRIKPLHRAFISLGAAIVVYFCITNADLGNLIKAVLLWTAFAAVYLTLDWIVICKRPYEEMKKYAKQDDGSTVFVFFTILIASFASFCAVLMLITSKDTAMKESAVYIPSVLAAMILSWVLVHTQYVFHYAHEYYDGKDDGEKEEVGGLEFPEDDKPEYLDFAYFSFCMGCTFQVSDVDVTSKLMRRIVFVHGLIAFFMNTFVVALTINLVAGMSEK